MRIAVLSDIHSDIDKLQRIKKRLIHNKIDLILVLGDFTSYSGREEALLVLKELDFAPVLALSGNLDNKAVLPLLEEKNISLHAKKKKINNFTFIGFGGGKEGNLGEGLFPDKEREKKLAELMQNEKNVVLLTHLPPIDSKLDLTHSEVHIGSKAVRSIIEKMHPVLHLSGHCHEAVGEEKINDTISINTGAVKDGNALILFLNKKIKWKRIKV